MNNADGIRIEEKTYFKATTANQELSQALTTGGAKTIERTDLEERDNIKKQVKSTTRENPKKTSPGVEISPDEGVWLPLQGRALQLARKTQVCTSASHTIKLLHQPRKDQIKIPFSWTGEEEERKEEYEE